MSSPVRTLALALLAGTAIASPAFASTFSAAELSQDNALLSQFNLVNLGNFTQSASGASQTIQGRALVGGNATFVGSNASVCTVNCGGNTTTAIDNSGATYGALTVFGNVVAPSSTSPITYLSVGAGAVDVKGTSSGNFLMNTGGGSTGVFNIVGSAQGSTNVGNAAAIRTTQSSFNGSSYNYNPSTGAISTGAYPQVNQSVASVFPFTTAYQANIAELAQGLANLPGTPGVKAQALPSSNPAFFTANADYTASVGGKTYTYGVVTTTLKNLASQTNFTGINNGTNNATFVIVTGDGDYTLPNLGSYTGSSNVIFDFVDAKTLKFAGNWNGSILAPLATITQQGGAINGSVVVASMTQSNALNDSGLFSGNLAGLVGLNTTVPEPASLALLGVGVLAAGAAARRRRA